MTQPSDMFIQRQRCECCGSEDLKDVKSVRFDDPCVKNFLQSYYNNADSQNADFLRKIQQDSYTVSECQNCGFLFQRQILNDEGMAFLYDTLIDAAASLSKRENAELAYYNGLIENAQSVQHFVSAKKANEIKVLDFGMGWGHWCFAAKACGYSVWGAELSEKRIAYARKQGVDVITDLRESDLVFDFIYSDNVFEHLSQPFEIAELLAARIAKGGVVHIQVPDGRGQKERIQNPHWVADKDALHPLEHINCFTEETLTPLMQRAGFRAVKRSDIASKMGQLKWLRQKFAKSQSSFYFVKL